MSDELIPQGSAPLADSGDQYEEISSDEVDSVLEVLDALMERVQSENIRSYLADAATNIYYLVYEDEDESDADPVSDAA